MIRPLIAGNWKMNAAGADGRALAEGVGAGAALVDDRVWGAALDGGPRHIGDGVHGKR